MKFKNKCLFPVILGITFVSLILPIMISQFNQAKHFAFFYKYVNAANAEEIGDCHCSETDPRTGEVLRTWGGSNYTQWQCNNAYGATNPAYDYDCIFTPRGGSSSGGGGGSVPVEPDPEPTPEPTPTPEPEPEPIPDPTKADFCNAIKNKYNTSATNCAAAAIAANTTNFAGRSPHVTLSNGLVLYISDYGTISALSDATDTADRKGFILFVDVNGSKGNSVLYEDVFPYYLTSGGKVIPGYKDEDDNRAGAANKDNLSMNVIYDSYANDKREVKLLMKDSNFKRAACATGYVKSSKYCDGDVQYNLCKKDYHDCRFIINKPFKLF